jgi:cbb3-type cytochrome oxidase subunit 3
MKFRQLILIIALIFVTIFSLHDAYIAFTTGAIYHSFRMSRGGYTILYATDPINFVIEVSSKILMAIFSIACLAFLLFRSINNDDDNDDI